MGFLSRLWRWIAGSGDETTGSGEPERSETTNEPRLDPENVTEVRTGSEEDPVEKLREVRNGEDGAVEDGESN
jgi:hypothetical protein